MKRILRNATIALTLLTSGGAMAEVQTVMLDVENMTCALCPLTVKKSLEKVGGVTEVAVSFEDKTAQVTFDDAVADISALTAATTNAGYPSSLIK